MSQILTTVALALAALLIMAGLLAVIVRGLWGVER